MTEISSTHATGTNGSDKGTETRPRQNDPAATLGRMRDARKGKRPASYEERVGWLDALEKVILKRKNLLCDAISKDFGSRSRHESLLAEIFVTLGGIKHTRTHLRDWMDPEERTVEWQFLPASARIHYQPLGVIGIISPWNYPVQLALAPLVGALAAGNSAMLKPSELVPRTSDALAELVAEAFDETHVTVVTGDASVGQRFASLPFDHLVFTGSTRVGKLVMRAAAENLVPVTLELGGKSPAIVGQDFGIPTAATRIMGGKLFNAGQTCIAPDYVMVPKDKRDAFVDAFKQAAAQAYPTLSSNPDYTSIVSERHVQRLRGYLTDAKEKGAKLVEVNPANETPDDAGRKLLPVLVLDPTDEMMVMQEEVFGPILPVLTYTDLGEAITYVNEHPRPLALYYFGHNREAVERVLGETVSGGVSINETLLHEAQEDLPFGGVGPSGMGHYHAREGFETFSKKKSVFHQARINTTGLMRPPYKKPLDLFLRMMLGK